MAITPAELAESLDLSKVRRPFPGAPCWEVTEDNAAHFAEWLTLGTLAKTIKRALEAGSIVNVGTDELLLLFYDLQYWEDWRQKWTRGRARKPPALHRYLLGRKGEDGNRHHWGELARVIRQAQAERRAEKAAEKARLQAHKERQSQKAARA